MADDDGLAPLITACPNCGTRFRVTEDQLQVAKGQVRCGSCLHVFDGTTHLILDGEELGAGEAEDVDALLDEIDHQIEGQIEDEAEPEILPLGGELEDTSEPELELVEVAVSSEISPELDPGSDTDTDPLEDGPDSESQARLKALEDELMADLKGVLSTTDATPTEINVTESVLEPELEDKGEDKEEGEEEFVPEAVEAVLEEPNEHTTDSESAHDEQGSSGHVEIELTPVEPEPPPIQEIPAELLQDDEVPKRGWGTWLVMLLAVIALPAQVLWFQYDEWVKDDTMRPVYGFICDVAGCELPVRRNVGLIVAKQSVLRDHPEQEGALIFDALLVNHATYPQSFPIVELSLINMDRFVVASGRFEPDEYLAGEALNTQLMDPRTPIHISLELAKPDQETPNFKIRFIPAS